MTGTIGKTGGLAFEASQTVHVVIFVILNRIRTTLDNVQQHFVVFFDLCIFVGLEPVVLFFVLCIVIHMGNEKELGLVKEPNVVVVHVAVFVGDGLWPRWRRRRFCCRF